MKIGIIDNRTAASIVLMVQGQIDFDDRERWQRFSAEEYRYALRLAAYALNQLADERERQIKLVSEDITG